MLTLPVEGDSEAFLWDASLGKDDEGSGEGGRIHRENVCLTDGL